MKYILIVTAINNLKHPDLEGIKMTKATEEYFLDSIKEVKEYEEAIIHGFKVRACFSGLDGSVDIKVNEETRAYEVWLHDEIMTTINIIYKEA